MEKQQTPPSLPPPPPLLLPLGPPPSANSSYNPFTTSVPSTTIHNLPPQECQLLPDIDWISLLSYQTRLNGEHNPFILETTSSLPSKNGTTMAEEDGKGRKGGNGSRRKEKVRHRCAFQTRSADDVLDDGYRWRKYGQKAVKNSVFPRSYYRCTHHTCNVKKQVQRVLKDTSMVVTTYEGLHNHPCEKLMQSLTPLLEQIQFFACKM